MKHIQLFFKQLFINSNNKLHLLDALQSCTIASLLNQSDTLTSTQIGFVGQVKSTPMIDQRIEYSILRQQVYAIVQKECKAHRFSQTETKTIQQVLYKSIFADMDRNQESVVMIVSRKHLKKIGNGGYLLHSRPLHERTVHPNYAICTDIKFSKQPSAYCLGTGFFVRPTVIATAAHVLFPHKNLKEDICLIRGFSASSTTSDIYAPILVKEEDLFIPKWSALKPQLYSNTETNEDWALLEVESTIGQTAKHIVQLSNEQVDYKQQVYCIGHGLGLPKKLSHSGLVIQINPTKPYFECQLSTFSGNSGSPVFDVTTNQLVGILVRGRPELQLNGDCLIPQKYASAYEGEECQILQPIQQALNLLS